MITEDWVEAAGQTRSRRYRLRVDAANPFVLILDGTLQEDVIWRELVRPAFGAAPANVLAIGQYGLTEIVNNVIDHSHGTSLSIDVQRTALEIVLTISDDGIGIFNNIRSSLHFTDDQQAVLGLSKGKLTTDRARHSGDGLFFVSRVFDLFEICSSGLAFRHDTRRPQWQLEPARDCLRGTRVTLVMGFDSPRRLQDVFDYFTSGDDDFGFTRTQVPVFLAQYGDEHLVSRSQARRFLLRLDLFSDILFDFQNTSTIGQGFADEVFRVYQSQRPGTILSWVHATPEIEHMIVRAKANAARD